MLITLDTPFRLLFIVSTKFRCVMTRHKDESYIMLHVIYLILFTDHFLFVKLFWRLHVEGRVLRVTTFTSSYSKSKQQHFSLIGNSLNSLTGSCRGRDRGGFEGLLHFKHIHLNDKTAFKTVTTLLIFQMVLKALNDTWPETPNDETKNAKTIFIATIIWNCVKCEVKRKFISSRILCVRYNRIHFQ